MTTIVHAAVGGVLGSTGMGPVASFALGLVSHYPLDIVPHWDLKRTWIDTVLTLGGLTALLAVLGPVPIFWGAVGGALPDLEHLLPHRRKVYPSHGKSHGRPLGIAGAWLQLLIILVCAAAIWGRSHP